MTTLEATMICLDNSEYMRNGDYPPSRWEVQKETVNALVRDKLDSNPEAQVGLLSMAGRRTQVHLSPAKNPAGEGNKVSGEVNKLMTKDIELLGRSDVITAIKTAQLVLKNRQNKNLKQRVVVFVGSPIDQDEKSFSDLGVRLNKLGISVDIINFGRENEGNNDKLKALVTATNGGDKDTSRFLYVPVGGGEFIDVVRSSAIGGSRGGGAGGSMGGGMGGGFGAGAQAEEDELQMVLRMSMEEMYQRHGAGAGIAESSTGGSAPMDEGNDEEEDEDDPELLAALALSMQMNQDAPSSGSAPAPAPTSEPEPKPEPEPASTASEKKVQETTVKEGEEEQDILQDEEFLKELIEDSGQTDMTVNDLLDREEEEEEEE